MARIYHIVWKMGNKILYHIDGTGKQVLIGKYRGADKFEKHMKTKFNWHNKWYVDVFGSKVRLFNTQKQAQVYLNTTIKRIHKTKQLMKRKK